jgi:Protein of unknown function (DUF2924)
VTVASCFEAGRDGFWLHRFLVAHGVADHVMEATSILVSRRARRAKTDRLDAQGLLRVLAYRRGERITRVGDIVSNGDPPLGFPDRRPSAPARSLGVSRGSGTARRGLGPAYYRASAPLRREWNGQMHRVAVLSDGFAWNGESYPSLSKVALAITGTRWNGPKFFGR